MKKKQVYTEAQRVVIRRDAKAWQAANPERSHETKMRWKRNNPDKVKASYAKTADARRESERARLRKYRAENLEKVRASRAVWAKANKEAQLVACERRRARLANADGGGVTRSQWAAIKELYGHRCAYCARTRPLGMDHLDALSRGGLHGVVNIVPACKSCNSSKHNKPMVMWLLTRPVTLSSSRSV